MNIANEDMSFLIEEIHAYKSTLWWNYNVFTMETK